MQDRSSRQLSTSVERSVFCVSGGARKLVDDDVSYSSDKKNGAYWKASFLGGAHTVESVRVKNRVDCCGERLENVSV